MTQGDVPDFDPRKKHAARELEREVRRAAQPLVLDARRWRELSRFQRKLRGTSGSVTIPAGDFIALMGAVRELIHERHRAETAGTNGEVPE